MNEGYNENYTEEEILQVREDIEDLIQTKGIRSVAETLINYVDMKSIEDYMFDKLDDNKKDRCIEILERIKKTGEVFQNDDYLHARITEIVEQIDYDSTDLQSREKALETLISAVEILSIFNDTDSEFTSLFDVVSEKLKNLNFQDFALLYSNSDISLIFKNKKFEDVIVEKIKKMSKPELIYFLLTTSDKTYNCTPAISKAKLERVEEVDDDLVTEVYNYSGQNGKIPRLYNGMYVDKVGILLKEHKNPKNELEIFASLNDSEFLRYLTNFEISLEEIPKNILKSKEFTNKMNGLSKEDLIYVADLFYEYYNTYVNFNLKNPNEYIEAHRIKPILDRVYGRILNEKLIPVYKDIKVDGKIKKVPVSDKNGNQLKLPLVDKDGHINYSDKDMKRVQEQAEVLKSINDDDELPYKYVIFSIYGNKIDEMDDVMEEICEEQEYRNNQVENADENVEIDDNEELEEMGDDFEEISEEDLFDDDMEPNEEEISRSLLKDFITANTQLQEYLVAYYIIDKLNNLPDKDILPRLAKYNLRASIEQAINEDSETDEFLLNYCNKRILSMPSRLMSFFPVNDNGCLNKTIELRINEMQKDMGTVEMEY